MNNTRRLVVLVRVRCSVACVCRRALYPVPWASHALGLVSIRIKFVLLMPASFEPELYFLLAPLHSIMCRCTHGPHACVATQIRDMLFMIPGLSTSLLRCTSYDTSICGTKYLQCRTTPISLCAQRYEFWSSAHAPERLLMAKALPCPSPTQNSRGRFGPHVALFLRRYLVCSPWT